MCGICGIINFNGEHVSPHDLQPMMSSMKYRGPDDEGTFYNDNLGFGFVRLSIIDLSIAGHQPMISADGRYALVFNGEIFNYIELRKELISKGYSFKTKTDTEVLMTSYMEWGEDCLNHFNGMWAFALFDKEEQNIFVARDRFGIKPFYYHYSEQAFVFGSEIPVILTHLKEKPKPDYQSIFDYMVFNRTDQTERTFFEEIKKLQHGHYLNINLKNDPQLKIKRWYNLREQVKKNRGMTTKEDFRELFSSAIGLRLRSDVPVGVCLSGGLDSSSIVSVLLQDYHKDDINTFSAVYEKGQRGDETEFIDEYRNLLTNRYFISPSPESLENDLFRFIRAHAEPIPTTSPYAQFKVMELASSKVVVTLDGQGADEMLAGYHDFFSYYFKELIYHKRFIKFFKELWHYTLNHRSIFGIEALIFFLFPEKFRTDLRILEKKYLNP
jgi:asparagine synthase (glutamine-hydrolysing)